jgi:hypothetical protein
MTIPEHRIVSNDTVSLGASMRSSVEDQAPALAASVQIVTDQCRTCLLGLEDSTRRGIFGRTEWVDVKGR